MIVIRFIVLISLLSITIILGCSKEDRDIKSNALVVTWSKTIGGSDDEGGESVAQTRDGGYVVIGTSFKRKKIIKTLDVIPWVGSDIYLIKVDSSGNARNKSFDGIGYNVGNSIAETNDDGFVFTGKKYSYETRSNDLFLVKTDVLGNVLWSKSFKSSGESCGRSVAQTFDSGFIVTGGKSSSFYDSSYDVYLIKTDIYGDTLWSKSFGGDDYDIGHCVALTKDGGYIIVGKSNSFNDDNGDVYLIKTDELGNEIWSKTFGGSDHDNGYSVAQTNDDGFIITGYTRLSGAYSDDVYLIKTDIDGNILWSKTFGGSGDDIGYSVVQTIDEEYIIVGETELFGGDKDVYLIKTDGQGDTLWTRTYGGSEDDEGKSVKQTRDGGFIIVGSTKSFGIKTEDVYLIKTDAFGYVK